MKKLLLFMGLLAISGQVWAQDSESSSAVDNEGFELGLKTGVNATWIINNNDLTTNSHHKEDFNVRFAPIGISAGYKFNDQASLMMEAFWSKQGSDYEIHDDNGSTVGKKKIKLDYIVVPILLKYTGTGETRFAFQFGAQAAFLLGGSETNTFDRDVTFTQTWNQQPKTIQKGTYLLSNEGSDKPIDPNAHDFLKTDWNAVIDAGMEHDLSENCYLSIGLRLTYGFKDILTGEHVEYLYDPDKFTLRSNATAGLHFGVHWFL